MPTVSPSIARDQTVLVLQWNLSIVVMLEAMLTISLSLSKVVTAS